MSKRICYLVLFFIFSIGLNLYSADNEKKVGPVNSNKETQPADNGEKPDQAKSAKQTQVDFNAQMSDLENQRRKTQLKIYQLRIKLIRENSEFLLIHNEIMKLHKKLAVELNNDENMKILLNQAHNIDGKIVTLIKNNDAARK